MLSGTEQFPAVCLHEHGILALKKKKYDFPGSSTVFSNSVLIQVEHHDALCFLCSARQALPWAVMYSYLYSCCQYRRTESLERSSECFRHFAAAKTVLTLLSTPALQTLAEILSAARLVSLLILAHLHR